MYNVLDDMGIREYAVKCAVKNLIRRGARINYHTIAIEIGCSVDTVKRAMPRLIEAGEIARYGSKRGGYKYVCN